MHAHDLHRGRFTDHRCGGQPSVARPGLGQHFGSKCTDFLITGENQHQRLRHTGTAVSRTRLIAIASKPFMSEVPRP